MRHSSSAVGAALVALFVVTNAVLAQPGERDRLDACKAMVAQAAQAQGPGATTPDDTELQNCRQIIKEWTLRDSRMSIDEQGRPLR